MEVVKKTAKEKGYLNVCMQGFDDLEKTRQDKHKRISFAG